VQPIAHLFKSQVYQLAATLDVPAEVQERTPTSDTYSAGSTQEEFFFRLPFAVLDTIWHGHEQGIPAGQIAAALGLTQEQVARVVADVERKERTTDYLRRQAIGFGEPEALLDQEVVHPREGAGPRVSPPQGGEGAGRERA
jgi:NAD+ synthase